MKVLITGAGGMLGRDLRSAFAAHRVTALARAELDITDVEATASAVRGHDLVVNAAADTRVDDAEADDRAAFAVNADGAGNLARAAARAGARMVQVSTDYVFDGHASAPYDETAPLHPASAYGRSKAAGERAVIAALPEDSYIVRTAWLYGAHGSNFARTMLRLARERETWTVVEDQVGQPTWTADLASKIVELVESQAPPGAYHGTSSGSTTWFGFARAVLELAGEDPERIRPTSSAAFARPAPRPAYSVLGHAAWSRAGLEPIRHWRSGLVSAFDSGVFDDELRSR